MHKRNQRSSGQRIGNVVRKTYRLIAATAIVVAVTWQLTHTANVNLWHFFSFFTIQSNVIAAVVLL